MKYAQLVVGPAGSGKSTYCAAMVRHGEAIGRKIDVVNLDPAAEYFDYQPLVDVRELISVADVMEDEELRLGPNGGLVFCMEYITKNPEWLEENFADQDEEYLLFDCPGQIELYTHLDIMKTIVDQLTRLDFRVCAVFLMDCQFASDRAKYFSGILVSLSTLISLEVPSVNILTKADLLTKRERRQLEELLEPQVEHLLEDERMAKAEDSTQLHFASLSLALAKLVDDYSLVKFYPLNLQDEESVSDLTLMIDNALQYGEDTDVKTKDFEETEGLEEVNGSTD